MSIVFKDDEHEQLYNDLCERMKYLDEYHRAAAYLLSLDDVCNEHIADIFDLQEDVIIPEALERAWQTGTSMKTTRLLFNLWNGYYTDNKTYTDEDGQEKDLPSMYYAPDNIFNCSYAPYYWQAIKMRYPLYIEE